MKRALTKSQASELLRAASLLPLASRDAFITEVDSRLCSVKRRRLTDADVSAAIASTLTALNVTTSHFMCDSAEGTQAMAKKWEIYDLNGNRRVEEEDDDDGVLKPNRILRVPMMMRDGMSAIQRTSSRSDEKMRRHAAQRFGLNDALDLHKPGQRFSVDAAARARVEQARAEGIREMCDAWKRKPDANSGVGSHELRGQQPGDQCTIRRSTGPPQSPA